MHYLTWIIFYNELHQMKKYQNTNELGNIDYKL